MKSRPLFKAALAILCALLLVSSGATAALADNGENHLPVLKEGIDAAETREFFISTGVSSSYVVNLSLKFEDPDGDPLTFYAKVGEEDYTKLPGSTYVFSSSTSQTITVSFKANDGTADSEAVYTFSAVWRLVTAPNPSYKISESMGKTYTAKVGESLPELVLTPTEKEGYTLSYQWYKRNIAGTYQSEKEIADATKPSYTPTTDSEGAFQYYCKVKITDVTNAENFRVINTNVTNVIVSQKSDVISISKSDGYIKLFCDDDEILLGNPTTIFTNETQEYKIYSADLDRSKTYKYQLFNADGLLVGENSFKPSEEVKSYHIASITFKPNTTNVNSDNYTLSLKDAKGGVIKTFANNGIWTAAAIGGEKITYQATAPSGIGWTLSSTSVGEKSYTVSTNPNSTNTVNITFSATRNVTFTVPRDAEMFVGTKASHYVDFNGYEAWKIEISPAKKTATYYYELPDGVYNMRLTMEGKITFADKFTVSKADKSFVIAESDLHDTDFEANDPYIATIYFNANKPNHITLDKAGDVYELGAFRVWQTIDTITNNYYIEPDFHVTMISGSDVISVGDDLKITALKEGEALFLVSYDKLDIYAMGGSSADLAKTRAVYKALPSSEIGVIAVTVGKGTAETGIDFDNDIEKLYYIKNLNGKDVEGAYGSYTFTPESGADVTILHIKPTETGVDYSEGFVSKDITKNEDGSVTAKLTDGRNVLRIEKDGKVSYQVMGCAGVSVSFSNKNDGSYVIRPGDEVKISISGIKQPIIKMSGIYNPQSGHPVYETKEGEKVYLTGSTTFYASVPASVTENSYELVNGSFYEWWFGSDPGAHHEIDIHKGANPNLSAPSPEGYFSVLPNIKIPVTQPDSRHTVEFKLQDGATIKLTDAGNHTILPDEETGLYRLPEGTYTYTVSGEGYKTLSYTFYFENKEDVVIAVPFELATESKAWDGTTEEPALTENVYQITNAKELAWFRDKVNGGDTAINGILLNDITLSKEINWKPIGNNSNKYAGTFDGNGHTINDMTINAFQYQGLFGSIATGGTVKNVTVTGTLTNPSAGYNQMAYHGSIAGYNMGTISGCTSYVNITGFVYGMLGKGAANAAVGGICGFSGGTIKDCTNYGTVDFTGQGIAGIVGRIGSNVKIISCANHGDVIGTKSMVAGIVADASYGSGAVIEMCMNDGKISNTNQYTAGIVASSSKVTVTSCFNAGIVEGKARTGGIVGYGVLTPLENCYNTGTVTGTESTTGGIIGVAGTELNLANVYNSGKTNGQPICSNAPATLTLSGVYFLNTTLNEGTENIIEAAVSKTSDELKVLHTQLGDGFVQDDLIINEGYPILKWQPHGGVSAPVIENDLPETVSVPYGEKQAIEVSATGDNLTYKWFVRSEDGEFKEIPYEVSCFMFAPSEAIGEKEYYVQVTANINASSESVNSRVVKVTVIETPQTVEKKIDAIGVVTLESKDKIDFARESYDRLNDEEKAQVSNSAKLTEAEAEYNRLVAEEQAKIDAVIAKIDAIGEVTLDKKGAIDAARAAYNELTEAQKARVNNIETLTLAELRYARLLADSAKAAQTDALIDAIGDDITLKSEDSIKAARKAYNALTDDQKALVTKLNKLEAAERKLAELKAKANGPQTGDKGTIIYCSAAILVCAAIAVAVVVLKKKKTQ